MSGAIFLLAAALLAGGLRDPRAFAVGGALIWAFAARARPRLGAAAAWLPWLAWLMVCALCSIQPWAAFPVLARWATAIVFFSLAAGWNDGDREAFVKILIAVSFVLSAAALITGRRHGFAASMTGLLPPYYNYTAFVLSAAAAGGAAWLAHSRGPRGVWRSAALGAAGLALIAIVLAHSRGAWLGLGVGALFWASRRRGRLGASSVLKPAIAFIALALLFPAGRELLLKSHRERGEARPAIWAAAAAAASESPWVGAGPGGFLSAYRRRPAPSRGAAALWGLGTSYAHSEPLQAAAETGWLGLTFWLLGVAAALRPLFHRARREAAVEAAAAAGAAMTAQLFVDNVLQIPALALLWLSALAVAGGAPAAKHPHPRAAKRWPLGVCALGAALCLVSWIPGALARHDPAWAAMIFPADSDAFEDLAYRAQALGHFQEADALWARAERLSPSNAVYPFRRAQLMAAAGHWDAAERLALRAASLEPTFRRARLLRAQALLKLGRDEEAAIVVAELKSSLAAPLPGPTISGYEREVSGFDADDAAALKRLSE